MYYIVHFSVIGRKTSNLQLMSVMPEPGGPRGPLSPPIFGRSVNPILTGEGRLSPTFTTGPLSVFHLPASLDVNEAQIQAMGNLIIKAIA